MAIRFGDKSSEFGLGYYVVICLYVCGSSVARSFDAFPLLWKRKNVPPTMSSPLALCDGQRKTLKAHEKRTTDRNFLHRSKAL